MKMKKRGRPPKENVKSFQYNVRLDSEDRMMLENLSKETEMRVSEIVRKGIRIQYAALHQLNNDN